MPPSLAADCMRYQSLRRMDLVTECVVTTAFSSGAIAAPLNDAQRSGSDGLTMPTARHAWAADGRTAAWI